MNCFCARGHFAVVSLSDGLGELTLTSGKGELRSESESGLLERLRNRNKKIVMVRGFPVGILAV